MSVFQQAYDWFFPNYPTTLDMKDPLCSSVCHKHLLVCNLITHTYVLHSCWEAFQHFVTRLKRSPKPPQECILIRSSSNTSRLALLGQSISRKCLNTTLTTTTIHSSGVVGKSQMCSLDTKSLRSPSLHPPRPQRTQKVHALQ